MNTKHSFIKAWFSNCITLLANQLGEFVGYITYLQKWFPFYIHMQLTGVYDSAQNNGWKLVGHSFKVATFLQTTFDFPIGNVQ